MNKVYVFTFDMTLFLMTAMAMWENQKNFFILFSLVIAYVVLSSTIGVTVRETLEK